MATHILCHRNETLPNTFPPPKPSEQDHGMMSEYEAGIIMRSTYPSTSIGALSGFDSDTVPASTKPLPTATQSYEFENFGDPALCLTPEKSFPRSRAPLKRGSDEGVSMKPRNSQKVRFDNFVEVKHMSPDELRPSVQRDAPDPALELSFRVQSPDSDIKDLEDPTPESFEPNKVKNHADVTDTENCEPISVLASDLTLSKHSTQSTKNLQPMPNLQFARSSPNPLEMSNKTSYILNEKPEHVLARPEFHSTLRVGKEIQQLEGAELDVSAAVKRKLKDSRKLKETITEKVAAKVNTTRPQFQGLVSVELSEENLIANVEKQKISRVKPAAKSTKPEDCIVSAPDILEYLTSDLQQQTSCLSLDGLPQHDDGPRTAPLSRAFDVYRHIRTWEGW